MNKSNIKSKELLKNTFIVAVGKICTQFISFFLLPLYTALLTTKEYGVVDLLNTYVSLFIPDVFLQVEEAVFRFLIDVRNNDEEKNKIISSTFFFIFLQALVFLVLYLIISTFINNEYKYFLAVNIITAMFSLFFLQVSRGSGDNATFSLGSLISGAGTIIFNVLFIVVFKLGAYGMLFATMIANISCALFVFFKKKLFYCISLKNFDRYLLKKILKYSIPLVPNQLSWWIINASDRTLVTYILGIGINGIYSASNKFSSICITLFNIFNLTWTESASVYINDSDSSKYFSSVFNTAIRIFSTLCLCIIIFMPFLFKFMITGASFALAYYQIPILLIATFFNIIVSMIGAIYVALKKTAEISKTSIYAAIINIIINVCLIKFIGLYAASISTLIAYLSMALYRYIDVQKYIKIKLDFKYFISIIILFVLSLFVYYTRINLLCTLWAIIVFVYLLINNYSVIKKFSNILISKINHKSISDN